MSDRRPVHARREPPQVEGIPVRAIEAAGYTDLVREHEGRDANSYVFDWQWGYLDHDHDHDPVLVGLRLHRH